MAKVTGKTPALKAGKQGTFTKRSAKSGQFTTAHFAAAPGVVKTGYLAKTRLKKSGGSLVATMPAPARHLLHLTDGQELAVTVEGSRVIMEPITASTGSMRVRRPKYTLDELLAQCDFDAPLSDEERAWMDEPPMGREVW